VHRGALCILVNPAKGPRIRARIRGWPWQGGTGREDRTADGEGDRVRRGPGQAPRRKGGTIRNRFRDSAGHTGL